MVYNVGIFIALAVNRRGYSDSTVTLSSMKYIDSDMEHIAGVAQALKKWSDQEVGVVIL